MAIPRNGENTVAMILGCAWKLFQGGTLTNEGLRRELGVSRATAHRYLTYLEGALPVTVAEVPGRGHPKRLYSLMK